MSSANLGREKEPPLHRTQMNRAVLALSIDTRVRLSGLASPMDLHDSNRGLQVISEILLFEQSFLSFKKPNILT